MVNNGKSFKVARCNSSPQGSASNRALHRLMAIEMAIAETVLYLDAYPENKAAMSYYKKLLEERERLAGELVRAGRPLTHLDAGKDDSWNWINSPWPWETEANL